MITIKVCRESSGNPIKGSRVALATKGITGGMYGPEYTNSDGEVHFETGSINADVFVDGSCVHSGHLSGRVVVYI